MFQRGSDMTVKGETVRAINAAYAQIALTPARTEELPIELEQLRCAIEAVNARVVFDTDPFDHRVALLQVAKVTK
jgi:hypothetical protein